MLKKTITVLMIIVLIVSMMVMPVSAATNIYNYKDFVSSEDISGEKTTFQVQFPVDMNRWALFSYNNDYTESFKGVSHFGGDIKPLLETNFDGSAIYGSRLLYYPLALNVLTLYNIPNQSSIGANISLRLASSHGFTTNIKGQLRLLYLDKDMNYINDQYIFLGMPEVGDYSESVFSNVATLNYRATGEIIKPDGAAYVQLRVYFDMVGYRCSQASNIITYTLQTGSSFNFDILSSYISEETNRETNEILGDINQNLNDSNQELEEINDKLDNMPGEIGDVLEEQANAEKEQASQGGDSNVNEVLEVVPDKSEGFMNAIQGFASSMSYTGTSATLSIPALTIPEIPGLIPKTVLWDGLELDFGQYIGMLPDGLLLLVQSLLTIALIVYCFKELYDTIAYVMTLRKGSTE